MDRDAADRLGRQGQSGALLSLAPLLTGLIQSLGTAWGLFRHYRAMVKLLLTSFTTVVLFLLGPIGDLRALETPMVGLLPIMLGTSTGASMMKRIAAPMVGVTLVVIPAV